MKTINYEDYNEWEEEFIGDEFEKALVEVNHTVQPAHEWLKRKDLKVNENGDVFVPRFVENNEDNGVVVDFSNLDLLCTKEDMLQAWAKSEGHAER